MSDDDLEALAARFDAATEEYLFAPSFYRLDLARAREDAKADLVGAIRDRGGVWGRKGMLYQVTERGGLWVGDARTAERYDPEFGMRRPRRVKTLAPDYVNADEPARRANRAFKGDE